MKIFYNKRILYSKQCTKRLTSLGGNPSMGELTLELTTSSFIDKNYKVQVIGKK